MISHSQPLHAVRERANIALYGAIELVHPAAPALDVLAESAECTEFPLAALPSLRAAEDPLVVCGALEMLVKVTEFPEADVAEDAFVETCLRIQRTLGGPSRGD